MASFTIKELAELTQSKMVGDPAFLITGVDDLESAGVNDASFLDNPRYLSKMRDSKAGVVLISPEIEVVEGRNFLITEKPCEMFQKIIEKFIVVTESGFRGIHASAVIHPTAIIADGVTIGPHAVVDQFVKIGAKTTIGPGVVVGAYASIGEECYIHSNVSIREKVEIGNRVVIQPGAVIGSCGFGYATDEKGRHHPLKQLGIVTIEDDVEIGANTTIDRARFKATKIGKGTKIDNQVQIAHQVELGPHNLIVSQVGISGSTKTGRNVVMGGQVGVIGHITIGDGVILAARSAAIKSMDKPGVYSGAPPLPIREFNEQMVYVKNIKKLSAKIKELEAKLSELST